MQFAVHEKCTLTYLLTYACITFVIVCICAYICVGCLELCDVRECTHDIRVVC